jgi:glycosyltransferase involved in cell wall biosynthesis
MSIRNLNKLIKNTSVVVCNKNSLDYLKKSIPALKKHKLKEILVIDGCSTDGSIEYVKKKKIKLYSDQGRGLSYSRKLGSKISKGKFVFFIGPDDVCDGNFFTNLFTYFINKKYDAATVLLKIKNTKTYWDNCLNFWFENIRKKGSTSVIGTPTLFYKKVFKKVKYIENSTGCDDTSISLQLINKSFNIGVLNLVCNQSNNNGLGDIKKKFFLYGVSDFSFYKLYKKKLSIFRKIYTFVRPLKHFFSFFFIAIIKFKIIYLPFVVIFTYFRFQGLYSKLLSDIFQIKSKKI